MVSYTGQCLAKWLPLQHSWRRATTRQAMRYVPPLLNGVFDLPKQAKKQR